MTQRWRCLGLIVAWGLLACAACAACGDDGDGGEGAASPPAEPAPQAEAAAAGGETEAEPFVPNLPEVPDLMADRIAGERGGGRPMALLNEAFVSEPPPTPAGFRRYAHGRSCKEVADNLLLEAFSLDHPADLLPAPCGERQRHSYVIFRRGEVAARERRLVIGAANGNPPPPMIDLVMERVATQLGATLEPHDAEPMVVHGSELSTRDYTMTASPDAAIMPGRWAARAVVVPKPWVRDESGMVRMGGPLPGLLVIVYEPMDGTDTAAALAAIAPTLEAVLDSVRFPR